MNWQQSRKEKNMPSRLEEQPKRFTYNEYIAEVTTFIGAERIAQLDQLLPTSWCKCEEILEEARKFGHAAYTRGYTYSYYVAPDGLLWGSRRFQEQVMFKLKAMSGQQLLSLVYLVSEACRVTGEVPAFVTNWCMQMDQQILRNLTTYLRVSGWKRVEYQDKLLTVYAKKVHPEGSPVMVALPAHADCSDFFVRMVEVLRRLTEVEQTTPAELRQKREGCVTKEKNGSGEEKESYP
jgi:hypothetical protein